MYQTIQFINLENNLGNRCFFETHIQKIIIKFTYQLYNCISKYVRIQGMLS